MKHNALHQTSLKNREYLLLIYIPWDIKIYIKLTIIPALFATIHYFLPVLLSFLTPRKWSSTDLTDLCRKCRFVSFSCHYVKNHKGIAHSFSYIFFTLNHLSFGNHQVWWRSFLVKVKCFAASLIDCVEVYCIIVPSSLVTGTPSIVVIMKYKSLVFFIT